MLLALAILAVHSFVPSHHARNVQFHATAHVPDLALLARGRGRGAGGRGPPARRIVRDANGNPINQRGGRGGRGRKGRGDRANQPGQVGGAGFHTPLRLRSGPPSAWRGGPKRAGAQR